MSLVYQAILTATEAHRGQKRKDNTTDYIVHCMCVTSDVNRLFGFNETRLCAAMLHDTLEDTTLTYDEIVKDFGVVVANIVKELTYDKSYADKNAYIESFVNKSDDAFIIKIIDRWNNIQDFLNLGNVDYAYKYAKKAESLLDRAFKFQELQTYAASIKYYASLAK